MATVEHLDGLAFQAGQEFRATVVILASAVPAASLALAAFPVTLDGQELVGTQDGVEIPVYPDGREFQVSAAFQATVVGAE